MNFESFLDWICNDQGIPYDMVYFITSVGLSTPFFLLCYYFYKKQEIKLFEKNGYLFVLMIPIGFYIYLSILFFSFLGSKNDLINFIGIVAYGPIIVNSFFVLLSIVGIFIVFVSSFFFKKKL